MRPESQVHFSCAKVGATGRYLECRSSGAVIAHLSCPREVVRAGRCHANATQARELLPTARRWGKAPQTNPEGKRQGAPPEGTAAAALCRHSWVHGRPRNRKVGPKSGPVLGSETGTDFGVTAYAQSASRGLLFARSSTRDRILVPQGSKGVGPVLGP